MKSLPNVLVINILELVGTFYVSGDIYDTLPVEQKNMIYEKKGCNWSILLFASLFHKNSTFTAMQLFCVSKQFYWLSTCTFVGYVDAALDGREHYYTLDIFGNYHGIEIHFDNVCYGYSYYVNGQRTTLVAYDYYGRKYFIGDNYYNKYDRDHFDCDDFEIDQIHLRLYESACLECWNHIPPKLQEYFKENKRESSLKVIQGVMPDYCEKLKDYLWTGKRAGETLFI